MAKKYKYLTFEERQEIERRHNAGEKPARIAAALGIHLATFYRELKAGAVDGKGGYSAYRAQEVFLHNIGNRGRKAVAEMAGRSTP